MDRLAECTPFYCKTGTHRATYGETLLDHGRRFDKKSYEKMRKQGRHWKATPGPGTYRTQRALGPACGDEMSLHCNQERLAQWRFGTGPQSKFTNISMGTSAKTPGPGAYATWTQFRPASKRG